MDDYADIHSLLPETRNAVTIIPGPYSGSSVQTRTRQLLSRSSAAVLLCRLTGRLQFVAFSAAPSPLLRLPASVRLFCVDDALLYAPFYSDFGPLNLACTVRFCHSLQSLLTDAAALPVPPVLYFHCNNTREAKSNAAVLIGAFQVWKLGRSAEEAYRPLQALEPFTLFRDASWDPEERFAPTPRDCISAFAAALRVGLFLPASFSVDEFEHFDSVDNGDLNVIAPKRFLAMASPTQPAAPAVTAGSAAAARPPPFTPNDFLPIFRHFAVKTVVRLNNATYCPSPFTSHGIAHHELFFPDGSCPPARVLADFLRIADSAAAGLIAVHCKAGLGRTGCLIACWLMREYELTGAEAIAWLRLCRPGSVIGEQQQWVQCMQTMMHREAKKRQAAAAGREEDKMEADDASLTADAKLADEQSPVRPVLSPPHLALSLGSDEQANGLLARKAARVRPTSYTARLPARSIAQQPMSASVSQPVSARLRPSPRRSAQIFAATSPPDSVTAPVSVKHAKGAAGGSVALTARDVKMRKPPFSTGRSPGSASRTRKPTQAQSAKA
jgi:cell division cycle 14